MNTWQEGRAIFCGGGSPGLPFLSRVALYGQDKEAAVGTYGVGAAARRIWALQRREWAQRQEMRK